MKFFASRESVWLVESERPGRYHNSPSIWQYVGAVRARNRREACQKADIIVGIGSSRVRPIAQGPNK